jgi:hypothetical protein
MQATYFSFKEDYYDIVELYIVEMLNYVYFVYDEIMNHKILIVHCIFDRLSY